MYYYLWVFFMYKVPYTIWVFFMYKFVLCKCRLTCKTCKIVFHCRTPMYTKSYPLLHFTLIIGRNTCLQFAQACRLYEFHTSPDFSSASLLCLACPLRAFTCRSAAMTTNGMTPRTSRLSAQEYANAMPNAISMPTNISMTVPN